MPIRRSKGFALMMTLWVLAVLGILLMTLTVVASGNIKASKYQVDDLDEHFMVRGAIARVATELVVDAVADPKARISALRGELLGLWVINPVDWSARKLSKSETPETVKLERFVICAVEAEDSRLPVMRLTKEMLIALPGGMSPVTAESIITFIEGRKKDKASVMVEELLSVPGVTPDVYYGGERAPGLREFVTSYSSGKLYINGVRQEVLAALPEIGKVAAREIVERISNGNPVEGIDDLGKMLGVTPKMMKVLSQWVSVEPVNYRIKAVAYTDQGRRGSSAEAVVRVDKGSSVDYVLLGGG